jgi:hypothetical protein
MRHLFLLPFFLGGLLASAQSRYAGSSIDLTINGTSTLHDWTMKSVKADCSANFTLNNSGQIVGMDGLVFSTPATSLKSEHSGMDNNAYKALKTDKNPMIIYTVNTVAISPAEAGGVVVICKGKLNIAGTARDEDVIALCKLNPDNTISVTGTEKISMKEFSVDPPTFMMGTIKTGNEIVLSFHLTLKKA